MILLVEVAVNLFIGDNNYCNSTEFDAIVHAKRECWLDAGRETNIHLRRGNNLYINMIDGWDTTFNIQMFEDTFPFITEYLEKNKKILIHCNEARSRSPAIALTYLTFEKNMFNKYDYRSARDEFLKLYRNYENCNVGIEIFLRKNWHKFK